MFCCLAIQVIYFVSQPLCYQKKNGLKRMFLLNSLDSVYKGRFHVCPSVMIVALTTGLMIYTRNNIEKNKEEEIMPKTEENLREAFAGESQANRKYLAFAAKADQEGYAQAARLFRAAAEAETIHAHNHLRALKGIRSTRENLEEAIAGELHEFKEMYPAMIEAAKAEDNKEALRSFDYANAVEEFHHKLYEEAMANLGSAGEAYSYYVCPLCGYTVGKEPPESCPVCGAKGKVFKKVD